MQLAEARDKGGTVGLRNSIKASMAASECVKGLVRKIREACRPDKGSQTM